MHVHRNVNMGVICIQVVPDIMSEYECAERHSVHGKKNRTQHRDQKEEQNNCTLYPEL